MITGYQYEQGDGNWISTQSTDADHTVTGLVNGRSHTFRVRALNGDWAGRRIRPIGTRHARQEAGRANRSERPGRQRVRRT